jgi:hypothetical protein
LSLANSSDRERKRTSSRLTNKALLPPKWLGGVDGRSTWVRRFHDLISLHTSDLGGDEAVSTAELSLVRRAATLSVELERYELKFAQAGQATIADLDAYQRASNTLRRLLESVGLQRRQKDITPDLKSYLSAKTRGEGAGSSPGASSHTQDTDSTTPENPNVNSGTSGSSGSGDSQS